MGIDKVLVPSGNEHKAECRGDSDLESHSTAACCCRRCCRVLLQHLCVESQEYGIKRMSGFVIYWAYYAIHLLSRIFATRRSHIILPLLPPSSFDIAALQGNIARENWIPS
jgi:hypothetical protein